MNLRGRRDNRGAGGRTRGEWCKYSTHIWNFKKLIIKRNFLTDEGTNFFKMKCIVLHIFSILFVFIWRITYVHGGNNMHIKLKTITINIEKHICLTYMMYLYLIKWDYTTLIMILFCYFWILNTWQSLSVSLAGSQKN